MIEGRPTTAPPSTPTFCDSNHLLLKTFGGDSRHDPYKAKCMVLVLAHIACALMGLCTLLVGCALWCWCWWSVPCGLHGIHGVVGILSCNIVGQAVWPEGVQGMWYQYRLFNENPYWISTEATDILNTDVFFWSSLAHTHMSGIEEQCAV